MRRLIFLRIALVLVLVFNITLLCSPVCFIGTYSGTYNIENYYCLGHSHANAEFERKINFSYSTATYETYMLQTACAYDNNTWGGWAQIGKNIVVRAIDDDYISHTYIDKYERESVFTLIYNDGNTQFKLTNSIAVLIQVFFGLFYIAGVGYLCYSKVVIKRNQEPPQQNNN